MSVRTTTAKMARDNRRGSGPANARSGKAKRRWLNIGPGLFLAILASIVVWSFWPAHHPAPQVLPPVGGYATIPSAPDPDWLLQQKGALDLTSAQTAKLERLVARWDRDTAGLREALNAATADLQKQMPAQSGKPLSLPEIQKQAAPMAALSRQMSDARVAWWSQARLVLTPAQRAKAEAAWAGHWQKPRTTR